MERTQADARNTHTRWHSPNGAARRFGGDPGVEKEVPALLPCDGIVVGACRLDRLLCSARRLQVHIHGRTGQVALPLQARRKRLSRKRRIVARQGAQRRCRLPGPPGVHRDSGIAWPRAASESAPLGRVTNFAEICSVNTRRRRPHPNPPHDVSHQRPIIRCAHTCGTPAFICAIVWPLLSFRALNWFVRMHAAVQVVPPDRLPLWIWTRNKTRRTRRCCQHAQRARAGMIPCIPGQMTRAQSLSM